MSQENLVMQYKKTLEILNKQKNILLSKIEEGKEGFNNSTYYIDQIINLDNNIKDYIIKIKNLEDNEKNNNKSLGSEEKDKIKKPKIKIIKKKIKTNSTQKNNIKIITNTNNESEDDLISDKSNEYKLDIDDEIIGNIKYYSGKTKFKVILPNMNFKTNYRYKNKYQNYY